MSLDVNPKGPPGIYWLASYPKSGNTWFRAFLANLLANGESPVDINQMKTGGIASNREWIDDVLGFDTADLDDDEVERLRPHVYRWALQSPGTLHVKIHDAYTVNASGEPLVSHEATLGAVYIIRNPLDVVSSAAAHWGMDVDKTINRMGLSDAALARTKFSPPDQVRQRMLSWSQHVCSWADAPSLKRLVIRYEDMLAQPLETFTQAVRFLGLPDDPVRIEKSVRFSDFKVLAAQENERGFRERSKCSERFFREGKSGGWRGKLTDAQITRIIADHSTVMRRFAYLDDQGEPV